jgi:hypothetical protein
VARASLFPANKQESLVVAFDTAPYPGPVEAVQLDIRAYTNGAFHLAYVETYLGTERTCRWDRHEQDHNSRDHFHPLPNARTADAEDRSFPDDLTVLLRDVVLPWVEARMGDLWEAE